MKIEHKIKPGDPLLATYLNFETKNLLIKCFELTEFDIFSAKNDLISIHLKQDKFSITEESKESDCPQSIFSSISLLRQVFEFIELNYHQSIRLTDVAQAVGYSSAYLTDLVQRFTGDTVNNWIVKRRLAAACTLLLETNNSVDRIISEVGYQNINHFYRQFRNYHQTTPQRWRYKQREQRFYALLELIRKENQI